MKKRITALALVILSALIITSCSSNKINEQTPDNDKPAFSLDFSDPVEDAEKTVTKMFKALKNYNLEEAQKYVDVDEISSKADTNENSTLFMKTAFESIDYKIVSSEKIDENNVIVNASISAIDMKPIMAEFFTKAMQYAFSYAFSETQPTEEEQNQKMEEILVECITKPDLSKVTNEIPVKVVKTDDEWKIETSEIFANAILGGLIDAANELNNSLGGNSKEAIAE